VQENKSIKDQLIAAYWEQERDKFAANVKAAENRRHKAREVFYTQFGIDDSTDEIKLTEQVTPDVLKVYLWIGETKFGIFYEGGFLGLRLVQHAGEPLDSFELSVSPSQAIYKAEHLGLILLELDQAMQAMPPLEDE